jgi:hypothetical protein
MCGLVEVRGLKKREARERAREFLAQVVSPTKRFLALVE